MNIKILKFNLQSKKFKEDPADEVEKSNEKVKTKKEKKEAKANANGNKIPEKEMNDDGSEYFSLGRSRRISLTSYKGSKLIDIREFYEDKKTGDMKPGKKGITLNQSEWKNILAVADQLKFVDE